MSSSVKILLGAWLFVIAALGAGGVWIVSGGPPAPVENAPIQSAEQSPKDNILSDQNAHQAEDAPTLDAETATLHDEVNHSEDVSGQGEEIGDTGLADDDEIEAPTLPDFGQKEEETGPAPIDPNMSFVEDGPYGPLPRIADDGTQPWQEFAAPVTSSDAPGRIAIIMSGLGLGQSATENVLETMPASMTLAFSPYGQQLDKWTRLAIESGFEYLLMVPMEPLRYPENDPGPDVLLKDAATSRNIENLHRVMGRFTGYIGLLNDMGSAFTANEFAIGPVLQEAKERGLMFLDARSTNFSVAASMAKRMEVPIAYNNRFLDAPPSEEHIRAMLDALKTQAKANGVAVGIARPLPITTRILKDWVAEIEADPDFALVPISAIANQQSIR